MKTAAEIARDTFAVMHSQAAEACENEILAHIVAAIEADRAQREDVGPDWRDDIENVRDADHVSVSWTAHDARGRNTFQSDIVITAAQAVGMFRGIGEAS